MAIRREMTKIGGQRESLMRVRTAGWFKETGKMEGKGGGRPWLTGGRQCNRACQNENLVSVELQIALTLCPPAAYLHEVCVEKEGETDAG